VEASDKPTPALNEVFSRALIDEEFRTQLFEDRAAAVSEYQLSDIELQLLDQVPREEIDGTAQALREGSVVGSSQATRVSVEVVGHFNVETPEE
jgi:hypothetical protein